MYIHEAAFDRKLKREEEREEREKRERGGGKEGGTEINKGTVCIGNDASTLQILIASDVLAFYSSPFFYSVIVITSFVVRQPRDREHFLRKIFQFLFCQFLVDFFLFIYP